MPVRVKICGIMRMKDALLACHLGAYAIGFVFASSPRKIAPEKARAIIDGLPDSMKTVGVFYRQPLEDIVRILRTVPLDFLQIYDLPLLERLKETLNVEIIPAFFIRSLFCHHRIKSLNVPRVLLDREKGRAIHPRVVWEVAQSLDKESKVFLAGGLNPDNVQEAIRSAHPFAVDVSSGIESKPGVKDGKKMSEFFKRVQEVSEHEPDPYH